VSDAATPLVDVRDLCVRFPRLAGDLAVVEGVSFALSAGETLGLVGESGSGKTLVGRALLGHLPASAVASGDVRVAGVDVLRAAPRDLATLRGGVAAAVFQDALVALNPTRTIQGHFVDVWASTGRPQSELRARVEETLEMVALSDAARVLACYPHELSGGMRQRALIALALLRRPAFLVADEPTTALDRVVEDELLTTLERLQSELGLAMLLISHDFAVVRRMCARVAVLYGGQLCEVGPTANVLATRLHPYTDGLFQAVASLAERRRPLTSIPGTVPPPSAFPPGCRFQTRCPRATDACSGPRPRLGVDACEAWCHHPRVPATEGSAVGA
jgi:oligopeptide/dipeptide ABC transporter ATP-binding protein